MRYNNTGFQLIHSSFFKINQIKHSQMHFSISQDLFLYVYSIERQLIDINSILSYCVSVALL